MYKTELEKMADCLAWRYLRLNRKFQRVLLERLTQESPELARLVKLNLQGLRLLSRPSSQVRFVEWTVAGLVIGMWALTGTLLWWLICRCLGWL
jgi:hypothetical protein